MVVSSKPRIKEKKALGKEWAVNWHRAIRVHFIDRRSGCVDDFPWISPWFSASLSTWSAFREICITNFTWNKDWIFRKRNWRKWRMFSHFRERWVESKNIIFCCSPRKTAPVTCQNRTHRTFSLLARRHRKYIYFFSKVKFWWAARTFLTTSRQPLDQFGWNFARLLFPDSFSTQSCLRILISFLF